ncbi:Peroxisomal membrane protein pex16, partial [Ascosphaera acerosa]
NTRPMRNGQDQRKQGDAHTSTTSRLRDLPVSALRVDHFRINPDRNDGLDYAFAQVVRNKAQRQCMDSCMRPDCCGRLFQSMADMRPVDEARLVFGELDDFDREAVLRCEPEQGRAGGRGRGRLVAGDQDAAVAEWFDGLPLAARKATLSQARALYY